MMPAAVTAVNRDVHYIRRQKGNIIVNKKTEIASLPGQKLALCIIHQK